MPSFTADIHGSGDIYLAGKVKRLTVNINGSGKLNSEKLFANNVSLQIKGSSEAIVHAEQQLDIDLSGSGTIKYYGHPTSLKQRIKGSGIITPLTPNS